MKQFQVWLLKSSGDVWKHANCSGKGPLQGSAWGSLTTIPETSSIYHSSATVLLSGGRNQDGYQPKAFVLRFKVNSDSILWPTCTWYEVDVTGTAPLLDASALHTLPATTSSDVQLLAFGICQEVNGTGWDIACTNISNLLYLGTYQESRHSRFHLQWRVVNATGLPSVIFAPLHVLHGANDTSGIVIAGGFPTGSRIHGIHNLKSKMATNMYMLPLADLGDGTSPVSFRKITSNQTGMPAFYGPISTSPTALSNDTSVLFVAGVLWDTNKNTQVCRKLWL
jgi:hypothetical protein